MRTGIIPGGVAAALTGAAMMVAVSSAPASAFTLSSPSLAEPVFTADIEHVQWGYWHRPWGYWHRPWGWHPWYRPWYWRPYYHPWRRCWWTWHGRFCRWY